MARFQIKTCLRNKCVLKAAQQCTSECDLPIVTVQPFFESQFSADFAMNRTVLTLVFFFVFADATSFRRSAVDWFEASGPDDECHVPEGLRSLNRLSSNVRRRVMINVCERVKNQSVLTSTEIEHDQIYL